MSIQTTIGSSALIGIGIGVGDVATLVNVGLRIGNWLTAPKSDADLLVLFEEPESAILRRRGIMDSTRFNRRWDVHMRLLENRRAQRKEGKIVERLLQSHSQWTGFMVCIVAALDEFADASTVRLIIKMLLQNLFSTDENIELSEDMIDSSLPERINGWRSAATVREMNIACRLVRNDLVQKALLMQGYIPMTEASDISNFLYWLLTQDAEDYYTSSSDLAGIACCLCYLSFDILAVEGFHALYSRETPCRVVYDAGPGLNGQKADRLCLESLGGRSWKPGRELSTTVSLSQPEGTFSTFPISRATTNICRVAWELGTQAARLIKVSVKSSPFAFAHQTAANFDFHFINEGTSVTTRKNSECVFSSLALQLSLFSTDELTRRLKQALANEPAYFIHAVEARMRGGNLRRSEPLEFRNTFHVVQAFTMGYWYKVLDNVVDTSDLEVKTVSGQWGYLSMDIFTDIDQLKFGSRQPQPWRDNEVFISTSKVLRLVGRLYANINARIADVGSTAFMEHPATCMGIIGKRTVLCKSLLRNSHTPYEAATYVILDCDVGGVPRDKDGLVWTGGHPVLPWGEGIPMGSHHLHESLSLRGSADDCTRHIQADWDGDPGAVLLCIRYKGRRIATVNPAFADRIFLSKWQASTPASGINSFLSRPVYEVTLEDLVKAGGRLLTPPPSDNNADSSPTVILVQSRGNDCFRYVAAAWYATFCELVLVNGNVQDALENCIRKKGNPKVIALIA